MGQGGDMRSGSVTPTVPPAALGPLMLALYKSHTRKVTPIPLCPSELFI